jgi:hypothetical protein
MLLCAAATAAVFFNCAPAGSALQSSKAVFLDHLVEGTSDLKELY